MTDAPTPVAPARDAPVLHPSTLQPRWVAHRGWSTRFPENSLAAFAAAIAAGADEIELDVRLSADGVPVVIHDPDLDRVTDQRGPLKGRTWSELRRARVRGVDGEPVPGLRLARLEEVLDVFGPHVGMNVHVKAVGDGSLLDLVANSARRSPERHVYVAGDVDVLEAAIARVPDLPRCCLARQPEPRSLLDHAYRYGCAGVQFVARALDPALVDEARERGLFRNLFYADTPEDAAAALALGIDGVLTNDVGGVRAGLEVPAPV